MRMDKHVILCPALYVTLCFSPCTLREPERQQIAIFSVKVLQPLVTHSTTFWPRGPFFFFPPTKMCQTSKFCTMQYEQSCHRRNAKNSDHCTDFVLAFNWPDQTEPQEKLPNHVSWWKLVLTAANRTN